MKRDPWLVGDFNEKCLEYEINCGCYIIDSNVTNWFCNLNKIFILELCFD